MKQQQRKWKTPAERWEEQFNNPVPRRPEPSEGTRRQAEFILQQFGSLEPAEPPACASCGAPVCPSCGTRHDHRSMVTGQPPNAATEMQVKQLRQREQAKVKQLRQRERAAADRLSRPDDAA